MTTSEKKQRGGWKWSEEAKEAQRVRMRQLHKARRMSQGQLKAWDGADARKELARRDMKAAWAMRKARVLLKIGKFQIIWG